MFDPSTGWLIMFVGCIRNALISDIWAYDPAANSWTRLDSIGGSPEPRRAQSMALDLASGRPVMFGGSNGRYQVLDDTWAFTP